ncbi:MAG: HRDC domain-containing protein [Planctomycetota bacterium]
MTTGTVHWVDTPRKLAEVGRELEHADVISVDTEQDSFFSHRTKVCVIQVGAFGEEWVIDALALDDFSPLAAPFLDERIPTIFHAGENDIDLLRKDCGLEVRGLFDSMSAAAIIGLRKAGLAPLIEEFYGVVIEKKYQRSDWRKRPLDQEQIEYAALDVRYLPRLREQLLERLRELGREEEAESDFARIERVNHPAKEFDPDDYFRLDAARTLDGVGRRVLRDMFVLREEIASEEDRAPFRVCPNHALEQIARLKPPNLAQLNRIRGLSDRLKQRQGKKILALIRRAEKEGPLPKPKRRPSGAPGPFQLDREQKRIYDRLRGWRADRSERRGVEPGRVVPNTMLHQIVLRRPQSKADLEAVGFEPWRVREYGKELLAVLRGNNQSE